MEELLAEVILKETFRTATDRVLLVRNLPKKFIYERQPKMVNKKDRDGYILDILIPDPNGEMVDALVDGLELDPNDKSIRFPMINENAKKQLEVIRRYIDRSFPRDLPLPEFADFARQPGNMMSDHLNREEIPIVDLPLQGQEDGGISPKVNPLPATPAPNQDDMKLAAARMRAEHARAAKKEKQENRV